MRADDALQLAQITTHTKTGGHLTLFFNTHPKTKFSKSLKYRNQLSPYLALK